MSCASYIHTECIAEYVEHGVTSFLKRKERRNNEERDGDMHT
jgi:hypothetical protein